MNARWTDLLQKKRQLDEESRTTSASPDNSCNTASSNSNDPMSTTMDAPPPPLSRRNREKNQELETTTHKRRSFRRSADLRLNQKTLFESLKQAAAQKRRVQSATKLQAVARGYLCRSNNVLCCFTKPRALHRRNCSEITMSDFGDSVLSLSSLEWSPRSSDKDWKEPTSCGGHTSSSTPNTYVMGSEFGDSFSSIFSQGSVDLPVQLPSRKKSVAPPRGRTLSDSMPNLELPTSWEAMSDDDLDRTHHPSQGVRLTRASSFDWKYSHRHYVQTSPSVSRKSPTPDVGSPRNRLPQRPDPAKRMLEFGHSSLGSLPFRDGPVRRPVRSRSPTRVRSTTCQPLAKVL